MAAFPCLFDTDISAIFRLAAALICEVTANLPALIQARPPFLLGFPGRYF